MNIIPYTVGGSVLAGYTFGGLDPFVVVFTGVTGLALGVALTFFPIFPTDNKLFLMGGGAAMVLLLNAPNKER